MGKLINGEYIDWIAKVKVLQKVVIVNDSDQILSLCRSSNSHVRANCWDLPGGTLDEEDIYLWKGESGKGDYKDILIKAILREVNEETGLDSSSIKDIKAIHSASGFNEKKGIFILALGYKCKSTLRTIKLSNEHSEFKWVTLEEFMNLEIGDDGGLIHSILNQI